MPYATNALDESGICFEEEGEGTPIVIHGGILDCVDLLRTRAIAEASRARAER